MRLGDDLGDGADDADEGEDDEEGPAGTAAKTLGKDKPDAEEHGREEDDELGDGNVFAVGSIVAIVLVG